MKFIALSIQLLTVSAFAQTPTYDQLLQIRQAEAQQELARSQQSNRWSPQDVAAVSCVVMDMVRDFARKHKGLAMASTPQIEINPYSNREFMTVNFNTRDNCVCKFSNKFAYEIDCVHLDRARRCPGAIFADAYWATKRWSCR